MTSINSRTTGRNADRLAKVFLFIDKRMFRWDGLPNLARMDFVRSAPIFLFLIPAAHQLFYPILTLPSGTHVELTLSWLRLCRLLGATKSCDILHNGSIMFEIGMPFSLLLIYLAIFFFSAGSVIYQISAPKLLGRADAIDKAQYIMQNFREVAKELWGERSNYFVDQFLQAYADNYEDLKHLPESKINEIHGNREYPELAPLADRTCPVRMNEDSIYYYAAAMRIKETHWDAALETIVWFQNETRWLWRYACGLSFVFAITISLYLVLKGFVRMVLY